MIRPPTCPGNRNRYTISLPGTHSPRLNGPLLLYSVMTCSRALLAVTTLAAQQNRRDLLDGNADSRHTSGRIPSGIQQERDMTGKALRETVGILAVVASW